MRRMKSARKLPRRQREHVAEHESSAVPHLHGLTLGHCPCIRAATATAFFVILLDQIFIHVSVVLIKEHQVLEIVVFFIVVFNIELLFFQDRAATFFPLTFSFRFANRESIHVTHDGNAIKGLVVVACHRCFRSDV